MKGLRVLKAKDVRVVQHYSKKLTEKLAWLKNSQSFIKKKEQSGSGNNWWNLQLNDSSRFSALGKS